MPNAPNNKEPKQFVEVLADELKQFLWRRFRWQALIPPGGIEPPENPVADPNGTIAAAHKCQLVGLAFSGGGIRSATFNLGVLQGLADLGLLRKFQYLSTVSGGGYIGSWLAAWIYRRLDGGGIGEVEELLSKDRADDKRFPEHKEPEEIRFLREYSNYLTPRRGFLGADTWTAIAIYLRNTLLNQAILILAMAVILLLPRIVAGLTDWVPSLLAKMTIVACLLTAISFIARNIKWFDSPPTNRISPFWEKQGGILFFIVLPLFLVAWTASAWIWFHSESLNRDWPWYWWALAGADTYFGLLSLGYWLLLLFFWLYPPKAGETQFTWDLPERKAGLPFFFFGPIAGAVGGTLFRLLARIFGTWHNWPGGSWHAVSFGPPLAIIIILLVGTLHIGLMGRDYPDHRREWFGRLGGWLLICCLAWAAAFILTIYSPLALIGMKGWITGASLIWLLSTAAGVLGGRSAVTGSPQSRSWKELFLPITPYAFVVGLLAGLSLALEVLIGKATGEPKVLDYLRCFLGQNPAIEKLGEWLWLVPGRIAVWVSIDTSASVPVAASGNAGVSFIQCHWNLLNFTQSHRLAYVSLACFFVACALAWRVNLNEFSMRLLYTNRLVRCYLGASNRKRKPNPFTGFDPEDDFLVQHLVAEKKYDGPYPIVNAALNLVAGEDLAYQERKATSFIITPLNCGFDVWTWRRKPLSLDKLDKAEYGFRPTKDYAYHNGGFQLGTAMGISGAALSPNMGYHSKPSLAFLMTLFNVRLGYWAGNPRKESTWKKAGPSIGLLYLFKELFGLTDDESKYVYLSDGGHFDNLGLYELVKRRCHYILVCDASADKDYTFESLAGAIRKCREDIGVDIRIKTDMITPHGPEKLSEWHCAVGEIDYRNVDPPLVNGQPDNRTGVLVYLKASLTGDESADVLGYKTAYKDFPHQTTADQWFTESQFESYRRLGQHEVLSLFEDLRRRLTEDSQGHAQTVQFEDLTLPQLFDYLAWYWNNPERIVTTHNSG